jgi:hypothetical protein
VNGVENAQELSQRTTILAETDTEINQAWRTSLTIRLKEELYEKDGKACCSQEKT